MKHIAAVLPAAFALFAFAFSVFAAEAGGAGVKAAAIPAASAVPVSNTDGGASAPLKLPELSERPYAKAEFENEAGWKVEIGVLADDRDSAACVRDLARECERSLAGVFWAAFPRLQKNEPPPLLLVDIELVPRAAMARWGGAECRLFAGNPDGWLRPVLALKWTRETSLAGTRTVLARAALARLMLANAAPNTPRFPAPKPAPPPPSAPESAFAAVPQWLVDAFLSEQEARANPALVAAWAADARRAPAPALDAIGTPAAPPRVAFWFLRHLRRELRRAAVPETVFFRGLAAGGAPEQVLARHFPAVAADAEQRALWWPVGLANLVRVPSRTVRTMEESAESFARETVFLLAPAGVDRRFRADALPGLRDVPAARHEVGLRLQRLRRELFSMNPVWHNAFQSYGAFLERIFAAKPAELARLWAQVEADAAAARQLQSAIEHTLAATADGAVGSGGSESAKDAGR